ncbi:hypothetical protein DYBT9275_05340 [Dyadobacter sp. CECT 9275]|uniref:Uncharacterized protein n=1 Tax=Dyadobacter helix TaxID=2822344 RepID=A0A916JH89_9BACT|nr:hypothetical protein DYBT9275_05340 [Dyadobacter sp. CECT 9275]
MLIVELAIPFTRLVRAKIWLILQHFLISQVVSLLRNQVVSLIRNGVVNFARNSGQFKPNWVVSFTEFSSMTFNISLEIRPFPSGNGWMANSR